MNSVNSLQNSIKNGLQDLFIKNESIVTEKLLKGDGTIDMLEDQVDFPFIFISLLEFNDVGMRFKTA